MGRYIEVVQYAILFFPIVVGIITIPFVLLSYHKYGSIGMRRLLIVYSFFFYLSAVYALVILPLPSIEAVEKMTGPTMQLRPFHFWYLFYYRGSIEFGDPSSYLVAMRQAYFYIPAFNLMMFIPFGIYMRYYFKRSFWQTFLFAFMFTLFLELTQLSGIYGIYPRAYRLFDVDDLILNTLGGLVGFWIEPLVTWWLPDKEALLAKSYVKGQSVSYVRRLVAFIVDVIIVRVMFILSSFLFVSDTSWDSLFVLSTWKEEIGSLLLFVAYFIVVPTFSRGRTIGKWTVQIAIIAADDSFARFKQLCWRYSILLSVTVVPVVLIRLLLSEAASAPSVSFVLYGVSALLALLPILFVIHIIWSYMVDEKTLFYEKMSHTRVVSTIDAEEE